MSSLLLCLELVMLTSAYENLAMNKTVFQEHPYQGLSQRFVDANNAVDGLKSTLSVWGGQCTLSDNLQTTATWWVNLTNIVSIHHITIYYMTGGAAWGPLNSYTKWFLGFSLYVSNATDRTDGILCFKDTTFNISTIPAVFNTSCFERGQYVIYHNERLQGIRYPDDYSRSAYNDLCEVEVFGCPTSGYYGTNCSSPCPEHCLTHCHIENGTCQACQPGYQCQRCEQAEVFADCKTDWKSRFVGMTGAFCLTFVILVIYIVTTSIIKKSSTIKNLHNNQTTEMAYQNPKQSEEEGTDYEEIEDMKSSTSYINTISS